MVKFQAAPGLAALLVTCAVWMTPWAASASLISIGEASSANGPITTEATDGGTGSAATSASFGNFVSTTAIATGSPLLPQPTLDTTSIDVSASGAGTLYMFVTEQGLTSPQGIGNFLSSFTFNLFNGSGIKSVMEETFVSASNALYGGSLLSAAWDNTGQLITAAAYAKSPNLNGPFSETVEYVVNATGPGSTNDSVNLSVPVPEPATYGLLGIGLAAMTLVAYRQRSATGR